MADDTPNDAMFQDAVDALRRGEKPRAKELLTQLLKTNQNNPTYWVWLSASVDNTKERIYCLQTALKLDPENGTAKRGLILLGALAPDETIQPFPMNRPRAWEEKLLLANEKPKERGFRAALKSPVMRLMGVIVIGVGLCAGVVFGFVLPNRTTVVPRDTNTPGPSPTFTATPTLYGATAPPTKSFVGPTPLWMLLPETYTPTPVYVNTKRAPESYSQFRIAQEAYNNGDWDTFILNVKLTIPLEPKSADLHYMLGEAYRFKGQANSALKEYQAAIDLDAKFGPPYLGMARARLMQNPDYNIESLIEKALDRDPNFGEVYLERARYFVFHNKPKDALIDLKQAEKLMPGSPDVYITYANAYIELEDNKSALENAEKAYALDITALPIYPLLGDLYIENKQYQRAVEVLEVYVIYQNDDAAALAKLGQAYFELGEYKAAVDNFDKSEAINRNGLRRYYIYRGLANLELKNIDEAITDLEKARDVDDKSYQVHLGLVRAYYLQEKFGTAYQSVDVMRVVAETDKETATALYWRALIQEKRDELKDAIKSWKALLAMDPDVMTPEMRAEADQHLRTMVTPTNTPKGGIPTSTPKGGTATATATLKAGASATPTVTATPKAGTTPSRTPTP